MFKIISPQHILPLHAMILELINTTFRCWNMELLRAVFLSIDVDCITSIPVFKFSQEDTWVWRYEEKGALYR